MAGVAVAAASVEETVADGEVADGEEVGAAGSEEVDVVVEVEVMATREAMAEPVREAVEAMEAVTGPFKETAELDGGGCRHRARRLQSSRRRVRRRRVRRRRAPGRRARECCLWVPVWAMSVELT